MKFKIILSLFALIMATSFCYASFPVKRTTVTTTNSSNETVEKEVIATPIMQSDQKSQGVALLLWFFLGGLAGHRWYLGSPWYWNVLFILTVAGLSVWAIVDLIDIITGDYPAKGGFKSDFW